jgi:hypothetical protein
LPSISEALADGGQECGRYVTDHLHNAIRASAMAPSLQSNTASKTESIGQNRIIQSQKLTRGVIFARLIDAVSCMPMSPFGEARRSGQKKLQLLLLDHFQTWPMGSATVEGDQV